VQAFGCGAGGSGLVGALLGVSQVGDGFGERGQSGDQNDRGERLVAAQARERGHQPGGVTELAPGRGGRRDAAVR
jgi:hypothetical protein